jgi:geranylgeranyl pyrophosphate synthase
MEAEVAGKPTGVDLAAGNVTLVVSRFLRTASASERQLVEKIVSRGDASAFVQLRERLVESGAVDGAIQTARERAEAAVRELEVFAPGEARTALETIPQLVVGQVDGGRA